MRCTSITCDGCGLEIKKPEPKNDAPIEMASMYTVVISVEGLNCSSYPVLGDPKSIFGKFEFHEPSCFYKWVRSKEK